MTATTKWITLALLGLAIAAAVAFAASRLVSEQIGIASESVSAGYDLAPAVRSATAADAANAGNQPRDEAAPVNRGQTPSPDTTAEPAPTAPGDESPSADQLEDREKEREDQAKQREDELEDLEKEREDREDEIRDIEEDRRDD